MAVTSAAARSSSFTSSASNSSRVLSSSNRISRIFSRSSNVLSPPCFNVCFGRARMERLQVPGHELRHELRLGGCQSRIGERMHRLR